MRATLFANVLPPYNPYIALLRRAVEASAGGPVDVQPRFTPAWVARHGRPGQVAHLHWIESHIRPAPWFGREAAGVKRLVNRVGMNRLTYPLRAARLLGQLRRAFDQARRAGVALVYTVHNLTPHDARADFNGRLAQQASRLILARAEAVHVHSRAVAEILDREYGRTQNVFVVPHGNYLGWYPNTVSRGEARRRLGLNDADFVYLFLGQIAPYKGLEELLTAFAGLDTTSARLLVAGRLVEPVYGEHIARRAARPGVLYRPGLVPDDEIQVYMNAADAVVSPYQNITTSGSVLLALSFGRPVIAPAFAPLAEVVPPVAGVLYPPGDVGALAESLRQARVTAWSEAAVLDHVRQYDWPIVGEQIAAMYRAALAQCGRAAQPAEAGHPQ